MQLRTRLRILFGIAVVLCVGATWAAPVTYYVATNGNDTWSGAIPAPNAGLSDGPFATLEGARTAIRRLISTNQLPVGGAKVFLRGGTYYRAASFVLNASDSGRPDAPIVYTGYNTEPVIITGGKALTGFTAVTDAAILNRINPAYRMYVKQVNLPRLGITDYGVMVGRGNASEGPANPLEVYYNGKRMDMARWPNAGCWASVTGAPAGRNGDKFSYAGDRPLGWKNVTDIWLHGYWSEAWADSYTRIAALDTVNRIITTTAPYGVEGYAAGGLFYAFNILEELDAPGEYYLDKPTGNLYFWPPTLTGQTVATMLNTPLVDLQGCSYTTIRGMTFEHVRGTAVRVNGGVWNNITASTVRNTGNAGVKVTGGMKNSLSGSRVYNTGSMAVILTGGDRLKLTPAGNAVAKNNIYNFGQWVSSYEPAVWVNGVGNLVSHNALHDGGHAGILLDGNDHLVEYNDIYNVCMTTTDAGALYMCRNFTYQGNVIKYNYFHTIGAAGSITHAIYLDDFTSGVQVFGNVVANAAFGGAFIGGGRDNNIENNIFVNCFSATYVDARGTTWAAKYFNGQDTYLQDGLTAMNYQQPPYSTRYPKLPTYWNDQPQLPKRNSILRNVLYGYKNAFDLRNELDKTTLITIKDNLVGVDPQFIDAAHGNYQLRDTSPAYGLGFQKLPFEMMGIK